MTINRRGSRLGWLSDRAAEGQRGGQDRGAGLDGSAGVDGGSALGDDRATGIGGGEEVGGGAGGDGGCAGDCSGGLADLGALSVMLVRWREMETNDVADRSVVGDQSTAVAVNRGGSRVGSHWRAATTREVDDGGASRARLGGVRVGLSHCGGQQAEGNGHQAGESGGGAHLCGGCGIDGES